MHYYRLYSSQIRKAKIKVEVKDSLQNLTLSSASALICLLLSLNLLLNLLHPIS